MWGLWTHFRALWGGGELRKHHYEAITSQSIKMIPMMILI